VGASDPRIFRFDASGCNGCDVELVETTALAPLASLGVTIVDRPADANVLVVTGGSNVKSRPELEAAYRALTEPRTVVAIGSCAATMGIFKGGYAMAGPPDTFLPVDVYVQGCPPGPQTIFRALATAFKLPTAGLEHLLEVPAAHRGHPLVDQSKCIGCAACAIVCPAQAIAVEDGETERQIRFTHQDCIFCATCQDVCPSQAVSLDTRVAPWFGAKDASQSVSRVALARCQACGAAYAPAEQIRWSTKKIEAAVAMEAAVRAQFARSIALCPTCRRGSLTEARQAKATLTWLTRQASLRRPAGAAMADPERSGR
jgi:Ni,Fe-hydrogenase III small subunit/Pyruvate/2-oxoacid:ferredoxin oxidoreductase delta subunit